MAGRVLLDALSALLDVCPWDWVLFFLCCGGVVLGLGFSELLQALARCIMVLLLMPLLVLTTILNYRLRQTGKEILPLDFLQYLCAQKKSGGQSRTHRSAREKKNRMRTFAPEIFDVGKRKES